MRTGQEMMELILGVTKTDEHIRAVLLVGSRANPTVPKDSYREGLARYQLTPFFRVLVPERNVCIQNHGGCTPTPRLL
ncbi:MAG: aminoglycoside 6-adenylyltransferase [Clostridiaceae bacterium]